MKRLKALMRWVGGGRGERAREREREREGEGADKGELNDMLSTIARIFILKLNCIPFVRRQRVKKKKKCSQADLEPLCMSE